MYKQSLAICLLTSIILFFSSCHPYEKQVTTGDPLVLDNAYANPAYPHSKLTNVLLLPLENPLNNKHIDHYNKLITLSVLRNFGKFNYFNIQFQEAPELAEKNIVDLQTNTYDRALLGAIGKEYNAQGILKISLLDFSPYPPMNAKAKAVLFDAETGEEVWSFDQVFDAEDVDTMNSLRMWWNVRKAGGHPHQRFENSLVRPSLFIDYFSYQISQSYNSSRENNVKTLQALKDKNTASIQ